MEYAPRGIRINAICPGTINTPMVSEMLAMQADAMKEIMRDQPIGRLGESGEIAAAVLWLCSPGASFVLGIALPVTAGLPPIERRFGFPRGIAAPVPDNRNTVA
jgi:NAD(P)-dependent dehydrogenase (short-subunit alcohol dehydrogenase family)